MHDRRFVRLAVITVFRNEERPNERHAPDHRPLFSIGKDILDLKLE